MKFANNANYIALFQDDLYMKGFLSNLYLRPSCYACSFKTMNRQSDITLADFWGVQHVFPEMDDDKGISIVMTNSEKGQMLFDSIKGELILCTQKVNIKVIEKYNSSAIRSVIAHNNRSYFFENIDKFTFENLVHKCLKVSFEIKVKKFVLKALSKIKTTIKK